MKLCLSSRSLQYLGSGYTLYFYFIKRFILLATFIVLTFGVRSILYLRSNKCAELENCKRSFFSIFSLANYGDEAQPLLRYLFGISSLLYTILNLYLVKKTKLYDIDLNARNHSPSDFSIFVKGLPKKETSEHVKLELNETDKAVTVAPIVFLMKSIKSLKPKNLDKKKFSISQLPNFGASKLDIEKVILVNELTKFVLNQKKIKKLKKFSLKKQIKANQEIRKIGPSSNPIEVLNELNTYAKHLKKEKELLEKQLERSKSQISTGSGFIVFKFKQDRDNFMEKHKSSFFRNHIYISSQYRYKNKHRIRVYEAPEPSDVLWKNLGKNDWEIFKGRAFTFGCYSTVTAVTYFGIFLLKVAQLGLNEVKNQATTITLSLGKILF